VPLAALAQFVIGLTFLLLLVTFRPGVIPVKAVALNLLSAGAAYGVPGRRVPVRLGGISHRRDQNGSDHLVAAAVPVRGLVRPVHGLPRVHPQPGQRAGRLRLADREAVAQGSRARPAP